MEDETQLEHWVIDHKACWEVWPLLSIENRKKRQVGFELNLYAQHLPSEKADPGCEKCQHIYLTLQQIARLAMPREIRPSRYDILPFDASFHIRPRNRFLAEIQLTVQIIHRQQYFDLVDDCERKCLDEIITHLNKLGVQPTNLQKKQDRDRCKLHGGKS